MKERCTCSAIELYIKQREETRQAFKNNPELSIFGTSV